MQDAHKKQFSSLLLDRDGTVIHDKHYLSDPLGVELLPGVGEALSSLAHKGINFFLVSNQSGVGRKYFSGEDVLACNARLAELLLPFNVQLTDSLFCPHAPEDTCLCRKPDIGMWHELQQKHGLTADSCVMVGDKADDILFASKAGLGGRVLTLTGKGEKTAKEMGLLTDKAKAALQNGPLICHESCNDAALPHVIITGFSQLFQAMVLLQGFASSRCSALSGEKE